MSSNLTELEELVGEYVDMVRTELKVRWQAWPLDLTKPELYEAVGALLARQVSVPTQLALSPGIWNQHIAPVLLRVMVDCYITLAWILKDPLARSRKFVLYGLGQSKLLLEHRKAALEAEEKNPDDDPVMKAHEAWANAQRFGFLTEVNVGSWSEISVREMAEEANCLSLYRYAYVPFSAAVHSMWHHVSSFNLEMCENPLHRHHKVPCDPDLALDSDFLYRAVKYAQKTFNLFDSTFAIQVTAPSAFRKLTEKMSTLDENPAGQSEAGGGEPPAEGKDH